MKKLIITLLCATCFKAFGQYSGGGATSAQLATKLSTTNIAQSLAYDSPNEVPSVAAANKELVKILPATNAFPISRWIVEGDSNSTGTYVTNLTYWAQVQQLVSTNCIISGYATSGHDSLAISNSVSAWTNLLTTNAIEYVTVMTGVNDMTNTFVVATNNFVGMINYVRGLTGLDKLIVIGYMDYDATQKTFNDFVKVYCTAQGIDYVDFATYTKSGTVMAAGDFAKYTVSTNGLNGNLHYNYLAHQILGNILYSKFGRYMPSAFVDSSTANASTLARAKRVREVFRMSPATVASGTSNPSTLTQNLKYIPSNGVVRILSATYQGTNATLPVYPATGIWVRVSPVTLNGGTTLGNYNNSSKEIPNTSIASADSLLRAGLSVTNDTLGSAAWYTATNAITDESHGIFGVSLANLSGLTLTNFGGTITVEYDTTY